MTSTTANLLNEKNIDEGETAASQRARIAKMLGVHAVTNAWRKTSQTARHFLRVNKAPLLTTAGTLVMMAGLAAASAGATQALETASANLGNDLHATLTNSQSAQEVQHSWQEGGLGGGGIALVLAGTSTAAHGLRTRRRQQSSNAFEWSTVQPTIVDGNVVGVDYPFNLGALDALLDAPYKPTLWERLETGHAAAVAERTAASAAEPATAKQPHHNGFDTAMVPGALDLNVIAGLTAA
ncbi:MAG TPA: hypothetical protein VGO07_00190 [Candidatus Saccharimonadales bacterium]|jgi:hypothetical protein|nr:hypothetical protein [Candidatus Saccharimonadales bacterium]